MKAKPIYRLFSVTVLLWTAQAKAENKFDFMHHLYDYIENTEVFELNQEEGRAYYIPQHSRQLNGKWKFFYADTPEGIPAEFYQEKFSDGKWAMIDVPANWEMRGWGDPLFRNVAAAILAGMTACTPQAPKATLNDKADTLAYAMGIAQTQGLQDYLVQRLDVDTTCMNDFVKGLIEGATASSDAKQKAYYAGIQIGQQVANQIIPGISREVWGEDGQLIDKDNFIAGFVAGVTEQNQKMDPMTAQFKAQELMDEFRNAHLRTEYADNLAAGEAFLDSIAQTEGIQKTESGLLYKVITMGNGAIPAKTDKVKVNYRGTLIDGTEFDSSYKRNQPTTFRANQVIAGWTEALTMMPEGSKWMLYIPQELAYGERNQGQIEPFSALVFEVELLSIEK